MGVTLNKATLIGRVSAKPILEKTAKGIPVSTFYLITEREWVTGGELRTATTAHACVTWARLAEDSASLFEAGDLVYVEGRLENKHFVDSSGLEKEITELVVNDMKLLATKYDENYPAPGETNDQ